MLGIALRRAGSGRSDRCRVKPMEDSLPGGSPALRTPIVRPGRPPKAALPDSDAYRPKKTHARCAAVQASVRDRPGDARSPSPVRSESLTPLESAGLPNDFMTAER